MPTIEQNRNHWGTTYAWPADGDGWSVGAGGTPYVWHGTIMPRICRFVPCGHLLEIAPGHGRFTAYLLPLCRRLTGADVTEECTRFCRSRFGGGLRSKARFFTNDGRTLPMVPDSSVDFVFSWDSLVHAERDVIESYLRELSRKLRPGAAGLIHHSNLGNHLDATGTPTVEHAGWRATSMTWQLFREFCAAAGLSCLAQEPRSFRGATVDCISLFRRPPVGAPTCRETVFFDNTEFFRETHNLNRISRMYAHDPSGPEPSPGRE
jgi:SAM-dependent methyltransferase